MALSYRLKFSFSKNGAVFYKGGEDRSPFQSYRGAVMNFVGNALKRFLIYLIRGYKTYFSDRAPCCRYIPSCSKYAIEAIEVHGAFKGVLLAAWRLLRCNPFSKGGYDPVPKKGHWRSRKYIRNDCSPD